MADEQPVKRPRGRPRKDYGKKVKRPQGRPRKVITPEAELETVLNQKRGANGLTEKQEMFCIEYVYNSDFDAVKAAKAVYDFTEEYADINANLQARTLMNNDKVLKFIKLLVDKRNTQHGLDKFWIINKYKGLIETGSEQTQTKCLDSLSKIIGLFKDETVLVVKDDPSVLAKNAAKKRIEEEKKARQANNVIPFEQESSNGTD